MTKIDLFNIKVRTPEEIIYNGEVKYLSGVNQKGTFDVLPGHAYFISLIKDSITICEKDDNLRKFELNNGLIKVEEKNILVFLGI